MIEHLWHYRATVERVIDGDTVAVTLDQGFGDFKHDFRVRLRGIDAPEKFGENASEEGRASADYLSTELPPGTAVIVRTYVSSRGKSLSSFERYVGDIYRLHDGTSIIDMLVKSGHAVMR